MTTRSGASKFPVGYYVTVDGIPTADGVVARATAERIHDELSGPGREVEVWAIHPIIPTATRDGR